MKVYTVQRMDKLDYDFSVEITNHGCYIDENKAKDKAQRLYKMMCAEYEDEMKQYSDTDIYDPEEYDSGALDVEEDDMYYRISFGCDEHYQCHSIGVDEWVVQE